MTIYSDDSVIRSLLQVKFLTGFSYKIIKNLFDQMFNCNRLNLHNPPANKRTNFRQIRDSSYNCGQSDFDLITDSKTLILHLNRYCSFLSSERSGILKQQQLWVLNIGKYLFLLVIAGVNRKYGFYDDFMNSMCLTIVKSKL